MFKNDGDGYQMQAKKIAAQVYVVEGCNPNELLYRCMIRSMEFHGWILDSDSMIMNKGGLQITLVAIDHLTLSWTFNVKLGHCKPIADAIGEDATHLAFEAFEHAKKLIAEESKKEV